MRRSRHLQGAVRVELGTDHTTETLGMGNEGDQPEHPGRSRRLALKACAVLGLSVPVGFGLLVLTEAPAFAASPTATVTCGATLSITADTASPTTVSVVGGNEKIDGFSVTNANYPGCSAAPYATITSSVATTFSTDGSLASLSFTGNSSGSSLSFSANHPLVLSPTSAGGGSATFNSNTLTYAGIDGTIAGGSGANTVAVPAPTSTNTTFVSPTTIGVGASSPGTTYTTVSGFTVFDASGVASTDSVAFTNDGSVAGVSFTGNGANSLLAFSGSHALDLLPTSAGGGTATFNSHTLTYSGIGGTITGGASTNTVTVPIPTSTNTTFVSATSIGVGATSPGTIYANLSSFTVFDASGVTNTKSVAFTTDGSVAGLSYTGNGADSALTFSGSHALNLSPTSAGAGTATFNSNSLTYAGIGGLITGGGSTNTATVPIPTSGKTFVLASSSGETIGVGASSPGTIYANLSSFTAFDASAVTSTKGVVFTTDGSIAGLSFTGNGTNSALAFSGSHALNLSPASAGGGTATFNSNSLTYAGIGGTITGGGSTNTVTVPDPGATDTTFVLATSSGETIGVGASSPGTVNANVSGFTVFDASGVTSADSVAFTTDGSIAGISFTGNGVNSALTFSGSHVLDLSPASAGGGTATFNSNALTYSGIGGTISGGGSTNTVTVPDPGAINTTFVSPAAVGVGTTSPGTAWATISGFTVFDASGVTSTDSVAFTNDGSVAGVSFTGNGANSSLAFSGNHPLNLSPTSAGGGTATFNSHTLSYSSVGGTITGGSGTNTVTVPAPTSTNTTFVSATSSGETVAVGATSPGTIWASVSGFTVFDASGVTSTKSIAFTTDGSIAGISFTGNGANSALTFSGNHPLNLSPTSAGGGTATFNSHTLSYSSVGGTITGGSGTNTVTVPAPTSTNTTFVSATSSGETVAVGATSPGTIWASVSGFTVFDASGVTNTDSVAFTTDGSIASLSFIGNGTGSSLSIDPASASTTVGVTLADSPSSTSSALITGANATSFSEILGKITTTGTSTNTVTLATPTGTLDVALANSTTAVSDTANGALGNFGAGFTFDATGVTLGNVAFSSDGSATAIFEGTGTSTTLSLTGSGTLTLGSVVGFGNYAASSTTTFYNVLGTIGGVPTIGVDLPSSGTVAVTASSTVTVAPGSGFDTLSGFTTFSAEGTATTTFTTDGSIAGISFTGNGANSSLAFSGNHPLNLSPTSAGGGTATFNSHTLSYSSVGGTITGGSGTNTVTVPAPTSTNTTFVSATSSGETVAVGATSPGTIWASVSGFTVFDASGVTSTKSIAFTTDGSIAGISFTGNGANSALTFSGTNAVDVAPSGAGGGTATDGLNTVTYAGIDGTIATDGSGTLTLPALTGAVAFAASGGDTSVSVGGTAYGNFGAGFTSFSAAAATGTVTLSSDGSATVTFTGNGGNTTLSITGSGTLTLASTADAGTYTGTATTTFMGVGGTITGVSTASVHLPGSGTVRVTVGTSSLTVSPGSGAETLSGFTTFAAEGTAATTFTTDGSLVGLSFTGNGVHTTIVFSGANPVDISPTSAGGGTATLNSTTLTYAGIGGTITGGAGTNTITVPTPTSGDITFVNLSAGAESVAVGTVAPGTTWAILSGFRVFDASAAVGSVDFTTDGSLAVTITGNGANSTLAVQPSTTTDAVTVELADSSSATTTVLIANEQTTSITHLLGAITTTGSGTNTVILPTLTGTLSFGTVNSVTQVADSGTTVLGSFGSGFGAFNLSSVTGAVALSTDGSTNETYTGNGTSTTITVTGTGTLTLGTAAGAGTYVGTGTTSFTGVGGTITGVPGAVVDLPGTGSVTVDALSTVLTVNSGSGPDTLSGFTTFTAEGSATTTFSTDGSVAGLHFIGNGASTVLTFSGGSAVDLSPTSAGGGTATDGSSTVVYSGIGGMITGGSGTNTVTVPTPGVGNTTFVAIAGGIGTLSVGASAPTTTLAKVGGFTVYAASGASGAIQFSTDGSLASLSLVGNGAGSSLVVDRPGVQVTVTLANSPSSASTVAVAGAQTSSFTEILGTITTDGLGKVVLPSPTGTLSVTATSPTVSVVNGVTTLGTFGAGFTTFDASAATGSVAFAADASLPDLDFIGNGTPSSISYASIGSGGVGVTFCLGTTSTANFANAPCGSSSTDGDTFSAMGTIAGSPNNDTFVAGASNLATLIVTGGGGSDTIDFSNSTHLVTVNLNNATNSETVAVAGGSQSTYTLTANNMENVVGADALGNQLRASTTTPGILVGGAAGDNLFIVTGGTNIINGGLGQANGISLSNAASAVNLDLLDGSFQQTGGAGLLLVVPGTIQSITGSPFGGTIVGGFGTEFINGAATAGVSETLDGGAGSVDITAGSGIETLIGGAGGGALNGGSGTDTYVPGGGTFTINPGSGTSILDLSSEPAAMNVNLGGSATLQLPGGGTLQLSAGEITGGWITGTHTGTINSPSDFLQVNGSTYSDVIVANGGTDHITSAGPAIVYSGAGADTITCTGPGCTVDYQLVAPNGTSNQGVCINLSSSATGSGTTAACDGGNPANAVNPNSAYKFGSSTTDTLGGVTRVVGSAGGGVDTLIAGAAGQTLIAGTGSTARLYASAAGSDYLDGSKAANVDLYGGSVVPPTAYSGVYTGGAFGNIFGLVSGAGNNTFVVGTGTDTVYAQMLQYNAALPLASAVISGNNTIISTVPVPTSGTPTPFSTVTIYGDPSDSVTWPSGTVVQPTDGKLDSDLYWIVNVAKTSGNQLEDESVQTIVSQRAAG